MRHATMATRSRWVGARRAAASIGRQNQAYGSGATILRSKVLFAHLGPMGWTLRRLCYVGRRPCSVSPTPTDGDSGTDI